jgi:hypothetical protein
MLGQQDEDEQGPADDRRNSEEIHRRSHASIVAGVGAKINGGQVLRGSPVGSDHQAIETLHRTVRTNRSANSISCRGPSWSAGSPRQDLSLLGEAAFQRGEIQLVQRRIRAHGQRRRDPCAVSHNHVLRFHPEGSVGHRGRGDAAGDEEVIGLLMPGEERAIRNLIPWAIQSPVASSRTNGMTATSIPSRLITRGADCGSRLLCFSDGTVRQMSSGGRAWIRLPEPASRGVSVESHPSSSIPVGRFVS